MRSYPAERFGGTQASGADPKLIERLAAELLAAKSPILLTSYAGRTPGASEAIVRLCEFAGIRFFEANMMSNIAHDSPCFAGFQPAPSHHQYPSGENVVGLCMWPGGCATREGYPMARAILFM